MGYKESTCLDVNGRLTCCFSHCTEGGLHQKERKREKAHALQTPTGSGSDPCLSTCAVVALGETSQCGRLSIQQTLVCQGQVLYWKGGGECQEMHLLLALLHMAGGERDRAGSLGT